MASPSGDAVQILKPGMIIAPQISINTAKRLVEELYKLKVISIKELNSYDDKNYKVDVHTETDNPHIAEVCPDGYVLKVLNTLDTPKQHVAAEHEMAKVLSKAGIICPLPEVNAQGKETSIEKLAIEKQDGDKSDDDYSVHLVRLMRYIPGERLVDIPFTPDILIQAGELIGHIGTTLKGFSHPALTAHDSIWSLASVPRLIDFMQGVTSEEHRQVVLEIIEQFKKEIVPNYDKFQKGAIHGDLHDENTIVIDRQLDSQSSDKFFANCPIKLSGIIDFGDCSESWLVEEIVMSVKGFMCAVAQTNLSLIDICGYVLAGYCRQIKLNQFEMQWLYLLFAAAYCQELLLNMNKLESEPENLYVSTIPVNFEDLVSFWKHPKDEIRIRWSELAKTTT